MARKLREVAEHLGVHLIGDPEMLITGVASFTNAIATDLVFVEESRNFQQALDCKAAAVIAGKFALTASCDKSLLISDHPKLTFARAFRFLSVSGEQSSGIDPSAIVHATVKMGTGVVIEERVVLQGGVKIGDYTSIGAGCVIGR